VQNFTQKYTIIQLFENVPEGAQFSSDNWPLHATLIDTFAIEWDVPTMVDSLDRLLSDISPVASVVGSDAFFGSDGQTRVALLQKTDSLLTLHNDVLKLLQKGSLALNDPQFADRGFVPHSTVQKHARLHNGDQVIFNALTIIDMFPNDDPYQRKVLKTIKIGRH
jgi:2'-5' RNA ligase